MQRIKASARIQRALGFRSDLATPIVEELQDAQRKFEQGIILPSGGTYFPWFLTTEISSIYTTINEERVAIPDDFIQEVEEDALWYYNSVNDPAWILLNKDDLDFLRNSDLGTGAPQSYALDASYFRIFPTPDAAYQMKMMYIGKDATLDDDTTENKWLKNAPELLMGEAGMVIAAAARDKDAIAIFQQMRTEAVNRLFIQTEARKHENRTYAMGGPD